MDREEKLILLYLFTALFALVFHVATTNERMANQGFIPHHVKGSSETYWFKPVEERHAEQLVPAF